MGVTGANQFALDPRLQSLQLGPKSSGQAGVISPALPQTGFDVDTALKAVANRANLNAPDTRTAFQGQNIYAMG